MSLNILKKLANWHFQTCPKSGQKDGAKTAQNIVYKTSTAAKVRACAEVEHLAMEIVFFYRFFQKSLAFQTGQWAAVSGQKDGAKNCPKHCDIVYKSAAKVRPCAEPKPLRISSIKNSTKFAQWDLICQQRFFHVRSTIGPKRWRQNCPKHCLQDELF